MKMLTPKDICPRIFPWRLYHMRPILIKENLCASFKVGNDLVVKPPLTFVTHLDLCCKA